MRMINTDFIHKNRKIAYNQGLTTFSGHRCKSCNGTERHVRNSACIVCYTDTSVPKDFQKRKRHLISKIKAQAKFKNIEFNITVDDVDWVDVCPILGIEIDYFASNARAANTASIDRKNTSLGYIRGNVYVISNKANSCKSDLTVENIERLLFYVRGSN